jgi:hypothetical protein
LGAPLRADLTPKPNARSGGQISSTGRGSQRQKKGTHTRWSITELWDFKIIKRRIIIRTRILIIQGWPIWTRWIGIEVRPRIIIGGGSICIVLNQGEGTIFGTGTWSGSRRVRLVENNSRQDSHGNDHKMKFH